MRIDNLIEIENYNELYRVSLKSYLQMIDQESNQDKKKQLIKECKDYVISFREGHLKEYSQVINYTPNQFKHLLSTNNTNT